MAADVRIGAALEQARGGGELLVMERDVERGPPRRATGDGAAAIGGVEARRRRRSARRDLGTIRGLAAAVRGARSDARRAPPNGARSGPLGSKAFGSAPAASSARMPWTSPRCAACGQRRAGLLPEERTARRCQCGEQDEREGAHGGCSCQCALGVHCQQRTLHDQVNGRNRATSLARGPI